MNKLDKIQKEANSLFIKELRQENKSLLKKLYKSEHSKMYQRFNGKLITKEVNNHQIWLWMIKENIEEIAKSS